MEKQTLYIRPYATCENKIYLQVAYQITDEVFDFLRSRGRNILYIEYGFGFQTDLIVYEV